MRLKSKIWVQAYLRRCQVAGCFAAVVFHGDDDAGSIYIRVNHLDGKSTLYSPAPTGFSENSSGRSWMSALQNSPAVDVDVESYMSQVRERDSDVWLIEVEDTDGRNFLDDELQAP